MFALPPTNAAFSRTGGDFDHEDLFAGAIEKIALERHQVNSQNQQHALDFSTDESFSITSYKRSSVHSRKPAKSGTLNPRYPKECVEGSGVDEELAPMILRTLSGDTVHPLLQRRRPGGHCARGLESIFQNDGKLIRP